MLGSWLDDYDRTARLTPGLFALAPVVVAALGFGLPVALWPAGVGGALLAIVGPAVLSKYVRARGAALEERLYDGWGGPPTTLLLRPPADGGGKVLAQRRENVERVTGVQLPAQVDDGDREAYHAAALTLISKTGDHQRHPTVHAENKNYGFERNLLGIRPEGLTVSLAAAFAVGIGAIVTALEDSSPLHQSSLLAALAASSLLVVFWAWWPSARRVRRAGDKYAARLLDAAASV